MFMIYKCVWCTAPTLLLMETHSVDEMCWGSFARHTKHNGCFWLSTQFYQTIDGAFNTVEIYVDFFCTFSWWIFINHDKSLRIQNKVSVKDKRREWGEKKFVASHQPSLYAREHLFDQQIQFHQCYTHHKITGRFPLKLNRWRIV